MTDPYGAIGSLVQLERGGTAVEVDLARGARAVTWLVDDLSLLRTEADASIDFGMYAMGPWAGRLRGNAALGHPLSPNHGPWAIHGTLLDSVFTVVERDGTGSRDRLVAECVSARSDRWPWPVKSRITWEVQSDQVRSRVEVWAVSETFPVVLGWHPWFIRELTRGLPAEWVMDPDLLAERGSDHLPTGALVAADTAAGPFDDAFHVPDQCASIRWPGALSVEVAKAPWMVIYDERPDFVCVEPQSGPPNGINDPLIGSVQLATTQQSVALDVTWNITREG